MNLLFGLKHAHNKRLKRDCQRVAFSVPLSRGGSVIVFEFSGNALSAP
ncbi:Uncharacterised protein [Vibrio cholerae]|nr:Uncharacterised protein [Vibrio cholerae]